MTRVFRAGQVRPADVVEEWFEEGARVWVVRAPDGDLYRVVARPLGVDVFRDEVVGERVVPVHEVVVRYVPPDRAGTRRCDCCGRPGDTSRLEGHLICSGCDTCERREESR